MNERNFEAEKPHPPHIKQAIQTRLRQTYHTHAIVGPFLAQMNYGEDVAFYTPDLEWMKKENASAYSEGDEIYLRAECIPEDAVHELRHVGQYWKTHRQLWHEATMHKSRFAFLANFIIEGDAEVIERLPLMPGTAPATIFEQQLPFIAASASKRLRKDFNIAAHEIKYLPSPLNETPMLVTLAESICVLPDGTNYLFTGIAKKHQTQLIDDLRTQFIDIPSPQRASRPGSRFTGAYLSP